MATLELSTAGRAQRREIPLRSIQAQLAVVNGVQASPEGDSPPPAQRQQSREKAERAAGKAALRAAYGYLNTSAPFKQGKPLAIGFFEQVCANRPDGMSKKKIRQAIGGRTHRKAYRRSIAGGGSRYGWDGLPGDGRLAGGEV